METDDFNLSGTGLKSSLSRGGKKYYYRPSSNSAGVHPMACAINNIFFRLGLVKCARYERLTLNFLHNSDIVICFSFAIFLTFNLKIFVAAVSFDLLMFLVFTSTDLISF